MKQFKLIMALFPIITLFGCGTYFNQPLDNQKARLGEDTRISKSLTNLPLPKKKTVVGVYNFRDQTGQFKPTENGSTFSTAVTQGATAILVKALEDSKWFKPIERENINNLLNERQIIRSTREDYSKANRTKVQRLAPLLFADILLEGGIISYDSNIVTGGLGARYFGVGGSVKYRQDRVTVYLRAVSTSTGEILKTVYVSKTILSQAVDASLFRFVNFQRLLEAETGFTRNEPIQLAITEAIEKSVRTLIIEGVKDELWQNKKEDQVKVDQLIVDYDLEKEIAHETSLFERFQYNRRTNSAIHASLGSSLINGDYVNPIFEFNAKLAYKRFFNPYFNLNFNFHKFNLANKGLVNEGYMSLDVNLEYVVLPFDRLTPLIYAGGGSNISNFFKRVAPKVQAGVGVEYLITDAIGITAYGENNFVFADDLDNLIAGKRDDMYLRFGVGLNIYLGKNNSKFEEDRQAKKLKRKEKNIIRRENIKKIKTISKPRRQVKEKKLKAN